MSEYDDAMVEIRGNYERALRAEIESQWGGKAPAPDKYFDLQYYERALKLLAR